MKFKIGDIVTINNNCTIADLNKNNSNGCRKDTFQFIENDVYVSEHEYQVTEVLRNRSCKINGLYVNIECLKLVEIKPTREMTISDIEEELGYTIKIIRD